MATIFNSTTIEPEYIAIKVIFVKSFFSPPKEFSMIGFISCQKSLNSSEFLSLNSSRKSPSNVRFAIRFDGLEIAVVKIGENCFVVSTSDATVVSAAMVACLERIDIVENFSVWVGFVSDISVVAEMIFDESDVG